MTRTAHRWLGLLAGLPIVVVALTVLGLNHQDLVRGALPAPAAAQGVAPGAPPAAPAKGTR